MVQGSKNRRSETRKTFYCKWITIVVWYIWCRFWVGKIEQVWVYGRVEACSFRGQEIFKVLWRLACHLNRKEWMLLQQFSILIYLIVLVKAIWALIREMFFYIQDIKRQRLFFVIFRSCSCLCSWSIFSISIQFRFKFVHDFVNDDYEFLLLI